MSFDNYKFVLETCASSENEVTGEDIELKDCFECDLKDVNLKEGVSLFSPKKKEWKQFGIEELIFPDFNFKVLEVHKDGVVLETSFRKFLVRTILLFLRSYILKEINAM